QNPKLQNLTDYSPSDAPWDAHKSVSDDVGGIYLLAAEYERYGPRIVADYPDARWMFLTLTVRNCAIGELGETLNRMNMAFQRLK
ncbi:protein rep, partial [Pseudocitrobacter faecalis]|uniref:protein rep n=1 Tax=Pseudocitrobacter faecalis TaxID=1398493 RepID=UPI0033156F68